MKSYYMPSEKKLEELNDIAKLLTDTFLKEVISTDIQLGELEVCIDKNDLIKIVEYLKNDDKLSFKQLSELTCVDYPGRDQRFDVIYNLLSLDFNWRIRLKCSVAENALVPSLCDIYANADWLEREAFDMFGVYFADHKDLRRLLTDFGFEGFPLRKDFPLTGFVEVMYDDVQQKVVYKPLQLVQAYRDYDKTNPWMDDVDPEMFDYLNKIKQQD